MAKITLEISDELSQQLLEIGDSLPEFLALSLQQPPLPAKIYHYILNFLASKPTPEEILNFRPSLQMQERLNALMTRNEKGELTARELLN
ncbi:MAG: hypothetical protein IGQ45_06690 [Cyanobacterium sp. T60_A2020_053]|nr:hypothetical protein [Cyanobacterium sp. T60_A2020_053]